MTAPAPETAGFDPDTPLSLYPLTYLPEGDEVTVGCAHTDSYAVLPSDGAALIRQLAAGQSPTRAAAWYAETYGEQVDMAEFLGGLTELEFINPDATASPLEPVRGQRLGRALFSPLAWLCYAALCGAALLAMVQYPQVRPTYQHLFFSDYMTVIELALFAGQFIPIMIHEAFHALAGRRLGLKTRFGIGRRLYFVVFETNLDGLVSVPRRQRVLPILAGLLADALVLSTLTLVAVLTRHADGRVSLTGAVCLAFAFSTLIRMGWQFYFFLGTDLYFLAITYLGCVDLQTTARRMIANRFWRLTGRPHRLTDESTWHPRDHAIARWYSWLVLAGWGFITFTLVTAGLPTAAYVWQLLAARLTGSATPDTEMIDSVAFVALNILNIVVIGYLVIRDRRRRRQQQLNHVLT